MLMRATEILTITATNEVRRSTLAATLLKACLRGAYRWRHNAANPFLTSRFVNIDA
ncbi:MAG: hypothetical protein IPI24_01155 [Ignavibacteria bacterium]|nr:hypothetical protein [Ignavibacteria bacterium]